MITITMITITTITITITITMKVVPVLLVLQQVLNARVRLFMNCVDKHSEMPNKSYFR